MSSPFPETLLADHQCSWSSDPERLHWILNKAHSMQAGDTRLSSLDTSERAMHHQMNLILLEQLDKKWQMRKRALDVSDLTPFDREVLVKALAEGPPKEESANDGEKLAEYQEQLHLLEENHKKRKSPDYELMPFMSPEQSINLLSGSTGASDSDGP